MNHTSKVTEAPKGGSFSIKSFKNDAVATGSRVGGVLKESCKVEYSLKTEPA